MFTQANNSTGNYIVFTVPGSAFTLTATPGYTNGNYPRAPVNGIQIVPVTSASATYTIAGRVQLNGSGFAGAAVTLNNGFTTTTDSAGNYSFSGLTNAMYTITPALNGYVFAPATQTVTVSNGNPTVNDFVGQALMASVPKPVSIDFVGEGSPMDLSETAGVMPESRWNNATGLSGSVNLIDKDGYLSGATITWQAAELDSLPIYDLPGNYRMMGGYLAANWSGDPATVTVSGLLPSANGYTVYVYADSDNGSDSRSASYSLSGSGTTTQTVQLTDAPNTDYSGASPQDGQGVYTQANNSAGNYVVFTVTGTSFTITATPGATNGNYPRAPINGIQIVPNP